jgi:hypothetical protein
MYHGVDFWKIVAWVKDELAARLNSFVRRWDSSSKTLRLTIGRGVFQLTLRSRKGAGLDRHQRRRVLFGCSQVTSHRECGLSTGIRIRHDLLRFGLLHSHRRSSSDTNLPHGGGQLPKCSARGDPSLRRGSPAAGPSPPGTGRPSSGPLGNGAGSDGHGALESMSVGSRVVEHKTDGDLGRVMETMTPPTKSGAAKPARHR